MRFGFSRSDLDAYKTLAIPSCRAARALDPHDDPSHVRPNPALARLYGRCHLDMKAQHARIQLIRVNDVQLDLQCIAIGGTGGDLPDACNIPSSIPGGP